MTRSVPVSVVIPTHARPEGVRRAVEALLSTDQGVDFEVIVVDDASPRPAVEVLHDLVGGDVRLRIERVEINRGPAHARNIGWRLATASVVAFTDDDCVPQSGWLAGLLSGIEEGADVVQGRTVPDPEVWGTHGAFFHTIEIIEETWRYETCNIAYRHDLLERLGGFDERFARPFGEDIDLAWRAIGSGAEVIFAEDAVVEHAVITNDFPAWLRSRMRRSDIAYLLRKHPHMRNELLECSPFVHESHPRAAMGLIGTLLALWPDGGMGQRLAGALLAAQYLDYRLRTARIHGKRRWWPVTIPAMMAGDCFEMLVTMRAAARERVLLL